MVMLIVIGKCFVDQACGQQGGVTAMVSREAAAHSSSTKMFCSEVREERREIRAACGGDETPENPLNSLRHSADLCLIKRTQPQLSLSELRTVWCASAEVASRVCELMHKVVERQVI